MDTLIAFDWTTFAQYCLIGLTTGSLIALVALGYTMVYGIVELVNFAHGDLVMLGSMLSLTLLGADYVAAHGADGRVAVGVERPAS